jgi:YegS/Rv2252/BmrU family lipid kinase
MRCKRAYLVVNPRAGQNLAKITDVIAVLAAAGWKTTLAVKEYGGHAVELAARAAEKGYDVVIAYGGDGTLCQVINGVMNANGQRSIVGVIPGGTANQWASEICVPTDPVKAALALIDSEMHKVDIGRVEVEGLTFPGATQNGGQQANGKNGRNRKVQATPWAKHHFLLTSGLGFDASVIGSTPRPLKYQVGRLAFGVAAAQKLPEQHAFPVEIHMISDSGHPGASWQGEALEVVVSNTRRYADRVDITPNAYIDDGMLDVCVITAGSPLATLQQITSLAVLHKPDETTARFFRGIQFFLRIPASVQMQLDGSAVRLKDYLRTPDWEALQQAGDDEHVMVNYRFDTLRCALRVAIPRTYDMVLFEESAGKKREQHGTEPGRVPTDAERVQEEPPGAQAALLEGGREMTVIGSVAIPEKRDVYIIAGTSFKRSTGESRSVAVRVDGDTSVLKATGENVDLEAMEGLREGDGIVVEGKKSKRGVMRARRVVLNVSPNLIP